MEIYTVYILYAAKANQFYIGQTNDLRQRLIRHNSGYELATKPYLPWKLVCSVNKQSRGDAMILEKKLKNLNTEDLKKFIAKYGIAADGGREA